ncbi:MULTISPECIES: lysylphosphatidylglycerol synthase domain-containing protein [unclassified Streptomyces]|uniref:lysylphosphatidylglycerol synthase domain-containing protein n=1 Tax=unclassified Streptomyces TaxID=2593676 RepID=UPI00382D0F09
MTMLRRVPLRQILAVAPLLLVAAVVLHQWPTVDAGTDRLGSADGEWLLAAGAATLLAWVCSAAAQQGAVLEQLPAGRLLATQFAASAVNHILPAGVGGNAVNLRFLLRCGLSPSRCAAALAVRAMAACVVRVALLAVLLAVFPHALDLHRVAPPQAHRGLALAAGAALFAALVVLLSVRPIRRPVTSFLGTVVSDVRAVHGSSSRAAALWTGSLAFPVMHAAVLVAVVRALHAPVPAGHVALAYLAGSAAAALLPTPGGLGSLDVALALALVTAGATGVAATSAVLAYRIVTVWLPLLPGVLVLAALVRRRVL